MNVKLLRRIKRHILAEPGRFEMRTFCRRKPSASCGTAACIAGWAYLLERKIDTHGEGFDHLDANEDAEFTAANILDLDYGQTERLFFKWNWPRRFRKGSEGSPELAKAAAARIEHFIKTGGEE